MSTHRSNGRRPRDQAFKRYVWPLMLIGALSGCGIDYNTTLFVAKSNVGIDVDTTPPTAEVSTARVAWSGAGAQFPDTVRAGFHRKEFALAPVFGTAGSCTTANNGSGTFLVHMPSFYADTLYLPLR